MKSAGLLRMPYHFRMALLLALSCSLTVALTVARLFWFSSFSYLFLVTNLILASVPYIIAWVVYHSSAIQKRWWLFLPAMAAWLLAFPNAPYIITDLIHLKPRGNAPLWYDAILLFNAAFNGLMLGLMSLDMVQEMVSRRFNNWVGWGAAALSIAAGSFGIYLGRFERYNSWDVLANPQPLMQDILHRFVHPWEHPRTWAMTLVLTAVLSLFYLIFRLVRVRPEERVVGA